MNPEQRIAAQHLEGPLLVLAGPGTGKTTTLVGRYEFLLFVVRIFGTIRYLNAASI